MPPARSFGKNGTRWMNFSQSFPRADLSQIVWENAERSHTEQAIAGVALQYVHGRVLLAWGLEPARIIGQGLGEIAGGCLAGLFSIEDALRLVANPHYAERIVFARGSVSYRSASSESGECRTSGYWRAIANLSLSDAAPIIDHSLTAGMPPLIFGEGELSLPTGKDGLPLLFGMNTEWREWMELLSQCYAQGAAIDWHSVFPNHLDKVALPMYPFQRKRYWFSTDPPGETTDSPAHPFLQKQTSGPGQTVEFALDLNRIEFLRHHQVLDTCLCPLTFFLEMALAGAKHINSWMAKPLRVSDLAIQQPLLWEAGTACELKAVFDDHAEEVACRFEFQKEGRWQESSQCRVAIDNRPSNPPSRFLAMASPKMCRHTTNAFCPAA